MPDAFGNVWPQYTRGWAQQYGPQASTADVQTATPQPSDVAPDQGTALPYLAPLFPWLATYAPPGSALEGLPASAGAGGPTPVSATPFVGQPMGGFGNIFRSYQPQQQDPNAPVREPSELSGQDLSGLASSDAGVRYNMGGFNPQLINISKQPASVAGGLAPAESLTSSLSKDIGGGGGGGGAPSGAARGGGYADPYTGGYIGASPGAGESGYWYPSQSAATSAGDVGAGAGMAGGGMGLSGGQLGSAAAGVLSSFGNLVAQNEAPMYVNPQAWANPPPAPTTFTFPQLSPNTGGVWYT